MKFKYAPTATKIAPSNTPGRYLDPSAWKTGPDPLRREQYYAWLKHRAQAKFRKEDHDLTFEEWESLWMDNWDNRGRGLENHILVRTNKKDPWTFDNCKVLTRKEYKNFYVRADKNVDA